MQNDTISLIKGFDPTVIFSKYIPLKKANSSQYKACCPFHKEKTPSFFINTEGFFKCFGCSKSGDVLNFIQEIENISFSEAVEKACSILNIENKVFKKDEKKTSKENELKEINYKVAEFFHRQLFLKKNENILDYLINIRNLNPDNIKKFKLGFCQRADFEKFIRENSLKEEDLIELSLLKKTSFGIKVFFDNRVTIPIFDKRSFIISFGARVLPQAKENAQDFSEKGERQESSLEPKTKETKEGFSSVKYLNGSNNIIYNKGLNLFNINNVYNRKDSDTLIVVEGYLDVITLDKFGYKAVASLGTGLTQEQLGQIFLNTSIPHFCYDQDNAGRHAMFNICKKITQILKIGMNPKFIILKGAKDADELLNNFGNKPFEELIEKAKEFHEFVFDFLIEKYDIANPNQRAVFEKEIEDFFNEIKEKKLSRNYISFAKNQTYLLSRSKTLKRKDEERRLEVESNFKSGRKFSKEGPTRYGSFMSGPPVNKKNILIKKLASFLAQNKDFLHREELNQIFEIKDENFNIFKSLIKEEVTDLSLSVLKEEYTFLEENKEKVFHSLINGIVILSLDTNNKLERKFTRKTILDNKLDIFTINEEQ